MNIREIAKIANVSIATVSRVINTPEVVLPETRERVLDVMRENNYNPMNFARSAINERVKTIQLLVPDSGVYLSQRLLAGIESITARKEYLVQLCNTRNDDDLIKRIIISAIEQKVSGLVFAGESISAEYIQMINDNLIPFVFIGKNETIKSINSCYINFEDGAYKMASHLLELEHSNIVLLCDMENNYLENFMKSGIAKAYSEAAKESNALPVIRAENSLKGGYDAATEIISKKPDAVFASGDELAVGLIEGLKEKNILIPKDIAVTGFSDSPVSNYMFPKLTTVEQPTYKLGILAARILFDLIDDGFNEAVTQEIVLLPKLKIRNSCGNKKSINTLFE